MAMDYPYTVVRAAYPNDGRASVTVQVTDGGILSEQQVVDAVKAMLEGTPGVESVTAIRYGVSETPV